MATINIQDSKILLPKSKSKLNCYAYIIYVIDHYKPSVRIIDLVSHTTYVVYVNFLYISGGTYSLKSTLNGRCFEKLFHGRFIYSQSFCQKSAERKSPKKYFSYFVLMSGLGLEPWLFV